MHGYVERSICGSAGPFCVRTCMRGAVGGLGRGYLQGILRGVYTMWNITCWVGSVVYLPSYMMHWIYCFRVYFERRTGDLVGAVGWLCCITTKYYQVVPGGIYIYTYISLCSSTMPDHTRRPMTALCDEEPHILGYE